MPLTVIRSADMVVAWDAAAKSHVYMPDADVAFEGGVLRFVGRGYDGPADDVVSGSGMLVMPGLVNIHSHPSSEPMNKGLIDEIGSPGFYNSSLYEYLPIFRPDRNIGAMQTRMPASASRSSHPGCAIDRSASVVTPDSNSSESATRTQCGTASASARKIGKYS